MKISVYNLGPLHPVPHCNCEAVATWSGAGGGAKKTEYAKTYLILQMKAAAIGMPRRASIPVRTTIWTRLSAKASEEAFESKAQSHQEMQP